MIDLTVLVKSVLEEHQTGKDNECVNCELEFPCPDYRIASDWQRQHQDLIRAWKNRTGKEVFLVRKFACAICSEKDTGLVCVECIADIDRGAGESAEAAIEEMASD
jgi:hypothetical protein